MHAATIALLLLLYDLYERHNCDILETPAIYCLSFTVALAILSNELD